MKTVENGEGLPDVLQAFEKKTVFLYFFEKLDGFVFAGSRRCLLDCPLKNLMPHVGRAETPFSCLHFR